MEGGSIKSLLAAHSYTVGIGELNLKGIQGWLYRTKARTALLVANRKLFTPILKHRMWHIMLLAIHFLRDTTCFQSSN